MPFHAYYGQVKTLSSSETTSLSTLRGDLHDLQYLDIVFTTTRKLSVQ